MPAIQLIVCILLCNLAGAIGVLSSPTGNSPWYQQLAKPSFNPPGWIFGPVWTLLYCMMGVALFLLWRVGSPAARTAVVLFLVQLIINAAWTPIFFRYHQVGLSLGWIILLWVAIVVTMWAAWQVCRAAALLLVPYLLWVSFASVLNGALWWLNH